MRNEEKDKLQVDAEFQVKVKLKDYRTKVSVTSNSLQHARQSFSQNHHDRYERECVCMHVCIHVCPKLHCDELCYQELQPTSLSLSLSLCQFVPEVS